MQIYTKNIEIPNCRISIFQFQCIFIYELSSFQFIYKYFKKKKMNDTNTNQNTRPSRKGNLNPMWGRHHSAATKQKQSDAAIRRNQEYKKALDSQHHVSMEEFLANNPSVKEYIKVLANSIIKEEINKFVWNKQHQNQRISIPL